MGLSSGKVERLLNNAIIIDFEAFVNAVQSKDS